MPAILLPLLLLAYNKPMFKVSMTILLSLLLMTISPLAVYRCQRLDWPSDTYTDRVQDPCLESVSASLSPTTTHTSFTLSVWLSDNMQGIAGNFVVVSILTLILLGAKQITLPRWTPPPKRSIFL